MCAAEALPDDVRFAIPRKQVLQGNSTHRRRKHAFVPARHVDGENLVAFVADDSVPALAEDKRDGNPDLRGIARAKLLSDHAKCGAVQNVDFALGYVEAVRPDRNLSQSGGRNRES